MNMIALKMYFQASIRDNEKLYFACKNLPHIFPRPQIFNATCRFRFLDTISFLKGGGVHKGLIWPSDYYSFMP